MYYISWKKYIYILEFYTRLDENFFFRNFNENSEVLYLQLQLEMNFVWNLDYPYYAYSTIARNKPNNISKLYSDMQNTCSR